MRELEIREITRQGIRWYEIKGISLRELPIVFTGLLDRFRIQMKHIKSHMEQVDKQLMRCRNRYLFLVRRMDRIGLRVEHLWKKKFSQIQYPIAQRKRGIRVARWRYETVKKERKRIEQQLKHYEAVENIGLQRYVKTQASEELLKEGTEAMLEYLEENPLDEE